MTLHAFLEEAFKNITPHKSLAKVGWVAIEPNYGGAQCVIDSESSALTNDLASLLDDQPPPGVLSPQGLDIPMPPDKPLLTKYIRTITLFEDQRIPPWVQVNEEDSGWRSTKG